MFPAAPVRVPQEGSPPAVPGFIVPVRVADPCLCPGREEGDAIPLAQLPQHAVKVSIGGVRNGVLSVGFVLGGGEGDGPGVDEGFGEGLGVVKELGELARAHIGDEFRGAGPH